VFDTIILRDDHLNAGFHKPRAKRATHSAVASERLVDPNRARYPI
jgi:hypothetical protein